MADDDLGEIENRLVGLIEGDPRLVKIAQREGIAAEILRDPRNVRVFCRLSEQRDGPPDDRPLIGAVRVRTYSQQLVAAAPNRPMLVEQPQPQQQTEMSRHEQHGVPGLEKPRRPLSKEFVGRRRNMRRGELKILVKYLPRETSIKAIAAKFQGRDIEDPEQVCGREIGAGVGLTQDQMFKIEKDATDYGCAQGWSGPGKAYRFSFRTITCCDKTADEVRRERKRRANERIAEHRRKDRLEKAMTATATMTKQSDAPLDLRAARMARTRAQMQTLYDAIGDDEPTVNALMDSVRRHPAWRDVDAAKMRRTTLDRLDMLEVERRIKDGDPLPGPRGSTFRTVKQCKKE
jgi:hypothetical protein